MIVHGDFFNSDWLRNRNAIELLGVLESAHNPLFNYGEFALIKSQAAVTYASEDLIQHHARRRMDRTSWRDECCKPSRTNGFQAATLRK